MLGRHSFRKSITVFTALAVWSVYSMVALAVPKDLMGEITVTGNVTVNGQPAISNSTIISGSTIVTGADSSAVISLGKTGKVEVLADTNITLKFAHNEIIGMLSGGKTRVSNAAGVAATVTTKDATIIADSTQADNFLVEVECSHTHVDTAAGMVTMREGTNDRQIAAGTSATAGNMEQTGCKPCMRPDSAPPVPIAGIGAGALALILIGIGGAAAAAIFFSKKHKTTIGGGSIVPSPVR